MSVTCVTERFRNLMRGCAMAKRDRKIQAQFRLAINITAIVWMKDCAS